MPAHKNSSAAPNCTGKKWESHRPRVVTKLITGTTTDSLFHIQRALLDDWWRFFARNKPIGVSRELTLDRPHTTWIQPCQRDLILHTPSWNKLPESRNAPPWPRSLSIDGTGSITFVLVVQLTQFISYRNWAVVH
jgi:hypothetical protein